MLPTSTLPRQNLARTLLDHNPFYLLSAMSMLAGIFALNNSLDWSPLRVNNLLGLILTLNTYEMLVVALGIFLWRRGLVRDATTLFVLEAFFVVDAGFLNSELVTQDLELGLLINVLLLLLAAIKVGAIFIGLRLRLTDVRFALVLLQLLILLAAPGLFAYVSQHNRGVLPPMTMYQTWWIVGLVPVLYLLMRGSPDAPQRGIVGAFVILPAISILAHLCTANWVFNVRWSHANMSPLLLGLSVAIGSSDRHVRNMAARMRIELLLPVLAIILAAPYRSSLDFEVHGISLTPLRMTLLAAALVYLHGLVVHRHPYFGMAGTLCLGTAGLGDSPDTMTHTLESFMARCWRSACRTFPQSLGQWGVISVVASFVLLVLGAMVSLLRPRVRNGEEPMN